ncbi:DUF4403 family protein [Steroidobacter gossypii]|uniref:DUF4403 family protein n=1 Tax=Steroidobacter gossypii TaxID=2805490 RepID=UPI001C3F67DD|nr:DUF4403 family protein [Steroidobacter gossypii]
MISVPIAINLAAIERQLNERIPQHLETIDRRGEVCMAANSLETRRSPEIKCDLRGWLKRDGRITLRGSGSQLTLSVPLEAEVTAQGRGEIGKNVTQTLRGGAVISADVTPDITPDWQPIMDIDTRLRWTHRPEFKLFDLIPVTVGGQAEPELRRMLDDLEASIPGWLAEARIKEQVAKVWRQVQTPFEIDPERNMWARFTPTSIGFSGIETTANIAKASFVISGVPQLGLGETHMQGRPTPLPALARIARERPRFEVELPVDVPLARLQRFAEDRIETLSPIAINIDGDRATLELSSLELASSGPGLRVALDLALDSNRGFWNRIDLFGWLDVKGRVTFTTAPLVVDANNVISLSALDFDPATNGRLADSLIDVAQQPAIRELIRTAIRCDFTQNIAKVRAAMGKELNRELSGDVRLLGRIDQLSVHEPQVSGSVVRLSVLLQGSAEVMVGG